jgi:biotin carboxylase
MSSAALPARDLRVLVLGRRQGLEAVLRKRRIPYALWLDKPPLQKPRAERVVIAPFPRTRKSVERVLEQFPDAGPFTHCIASVEAAVVAASHARRVLGARKSAHTVARRCHDKLIMKRQLREAGVPVTDFLDLNRPEERERTDELGYPLVIKDRVSSGSRGVEVLTDPDADLNEVRTRDRMAERFVTGGEMSVEAFVHNGRIVWTNTTRYWKPKYVNVVPAGLDAAMQRQVLELNQRAISALAVRWGMTHLELFMSDEGLMVGEVALRPPGGYIMRCLELAYDFDPWGAFCSVELGEPPSLPRVPGRPTAVVVLHPGEGRVRRINGLDEVRAHPAHVDSLIKVEVGTDITERIGVGEDVGRVLLQAEDQEALDEAIRFVEERLVFELVSPTTD